MTLGRVSHEYRASTRNERKTIRSGWLNFVKIKELSVLTALLAASLRIPTPAMPLEKSPLLNGKHFRRVKAMVQYLSKVRFNDLKIPQLKRLKKFT
jgi:hypothetical protein